MSLLVTQSPNTLQTSDTVGVNDKSVVFAYNGFSGDVNAITGKVADNSHTRNLVKTPYGIGGFTGAATTDIGIFNIPATSAAEVTLVVQYYETLISQANWCDLVSVGDGASSYVLEIDINFSNSYRVYAVGSYEYVVLESGVPRTQGLRTLAIRFSKQLNKVDLFLDNRLIGSSATYTGSKTLTKVCLATRTSGETNRIYKNGGILNTFVVANRYVDNSKILSYLKNPWQIFKPEQKPFYFNNTTTPSATGTGSLAALGLSAPTGTTVQTSIASGSLAALSLSTPTCSATTVSTVTASGVVAPLSLSAPTGVSVQTSIASGALSTLSLSAPTGTTSTISAVTASGSLIALSLSAPATTTVQTSIASGAVSALSLSAPTGAASTVASVIASGNIIAINLNAPAAQPVLIVRGVGYFNPMTLIAPDHVLAPSTTVPEIVNFDTMIQRDVTSDVGFTRSISYTTDINRSVSFTIER